ncbi:MAG: ABC transporter substrate-binding protein [Chloroflexota bacterium]
MRLSFPSAALCLTAFTLAACLSPVMASSPQQAPTASPVPPTPTPLPQRAPLLRIAVLGDVTTTNVWALFDEPGADYWNHAAQAAYWPRLYTLAPLSLDPSTRSGQRPEPAAAKSAPPAPACDPAACAATITLRPGLAWTDGFPLTASDVAFTVNTALQFRLGGHWRSAYDPDVLDHAEALSEDAVRFYFKRQPTVAEWQYGALQGPILNQAYWQPRIAQAASLLPEDTLLPAILELEAQSAEMQAQVEALNLSLNGMAPASQQYQQTVKQAEDIQEELNSIDHQRDKAREKYEAQLASARAALYALPNAMEPTLGAWKFESRIDGAFENMANFGTVYGDPWFDKARYIVYPDEAQAVEALLDDEADLILTPDGLSPEAVPQLAGDPAITVSRNSSRSARFLAFNQANPYLAETTLRQALACMLDSPSLAQALGGQALPLTSFVLDAYWQAGDLSMPCAGLPAEVRLAKAVRLLKSAGYAWEKEPAPGVSGKALTAPDGNALPRLTLLAPASGEDALRAQAADYIAGQAGLLGFDLEIKPADLDTILYAVYASGSYDLAVLGWRLSAYPAYLCDWFTPAGQNPFAYSGSRLKSACEAWAGTSDLDEAQIRAAEVQSILMEELPLVPLYVEARYDAYRNLRYPFTGVLDGLGGLYGAPEEAIPNP